MFWGHSVNKTVGRNANFLALRANGTVLHFPPQNERAPQKAILYSVHRKATMSALYHIYFFLQCKCILEVMLAWFNSDIKEAIFMFCFVIPEFSLLLRITSSEAGKRKEEKDHRPNLGLDFEPGLKTTFTFSVSTPLGLGLCHRLRHDNLEGLSKTRIIRIIMHPSSIATNSKFASILKRCSSASFSFIGTTLACARPSLLFTIWVTSLPRNNYLPKPLV